MPTVDGVRLRLVQPSIEQTIKWEPAKFGDNLRRQVALSIEPGQTQPTVIIWPEAAEPYPLDGNPENARTLADLLKLKPDNC